MCWIGEGMRRREKKRGGPHHNPCGNRLDTRNDGTSASLSRCQQCNSTGRTGNLAPLRASFEAEVAEVKKKIDSRARPGPNIRSVVLRCNTPRATTASRWQLAAACMIAPVGGATFAGSSRFEMVRRRDKAGRQDQGLGRDGSTIAPGEPAFDAGRSALL